MADENGYPPRPRHAVPTLLLVTAIVVAVASASGLIWVLFSKTEGPAPVLRTFAQRIRDEDCAGSHELLEESVRRRIPEETWCEMLPGIRESLDPGFRVDQMVLKRGVAELTIRGRLSSGTTVWRLRKVGKSWRVLGPAQGFQIPVAPAA